MYASIPTYAHLSTTRAKKKKEKKKNSYAEHLKVGFGLLFVRSKREREVETRTHKDMENLVMVMRSDSDRM